MAYLGSVYNPSYNPYDEEEEDSMLVPLAPVRRRGIIERDLPPSPAALAAVAPRSNIIERDLPPSSAAVPVQNGSQLNRQVAVATTHPAASSRRRLKGIQARRDAPVVQTNTSAGQGTGIVTNQNPYPGTVAGNGLGSPQPLVGYNSPYPHVLYGGLMDTTYPYMTMVNNTLAAMRSAGVLPQAPGQAPAASSTPRVTRTARATRSTRTTRAPRATTPAPTSASNIPASMPLMPAHMPASNIPASMPLMPAHTSASMPLMPAHTSASTPEPTLMPAHTSASIPEPIPTLFKNIGSSLGTVARSIGRALDNSVIANEADSLGDYTPAPNISLDTVARGIGRALDNSVIANEADSLGDYAPVSDTFLNTMARSIGRALDNSVIANEADSLGDYTSAPNISLSTVASTEDPIVRIPSAIEQSIVAGLISGYRPVSRLPYRTNLLGGYIPIDTTVDNTAERAVSQIADAARSAGSALYNSVSPENANVLGGYIPVDIQADNTAERAARTASQVADTARNIGGSLSLPTVTMGNSNLLGGYIPVDTTADNTAERAASQIANAARNAGSVLYNSVSPENANVLGGYIPVDIQADNTAERAAAYINNAVGNAGDVLRNSVSTENSDLLGGYIPVDASTNNTPRGVPELTSLVRDAWNSVYDYASPIANEISDAISRANGAYIPPELHIMPNGELIDPDEAGREVFRNNIPSLNMGLTTSPDFSGMQVTPEEQDNAMTALSLIAAGLPALGISAGRQLLMARMGASASSLSDTAVVNTLQNITRNATPRTMMRMRHARWENRVSPRLPTSATRPFRNLTGNNMYSGDYYLF